MSPGGAGRRMEGKRDGLDLPFKPARMKKSASGTCPRLTRRGGAVGCRPTISTEICTKEKVNRGWK